MVNDNRQLMAIAHKKSLRVESFRDRQSTCPNKRWVKDEEHKCLLLKCTREGNKTGNCNVGSCPEKK